MFSQAAQEFITEFHQSHGGLDNVYTADAAAHDLIHSVFGLGVALEDEEIVLNIAEVLSGSPCNPLHENRVNFLISLVAEMLPEIFTELTNFYYE